MPAPTGPISLALANLQTLLANSPNWQTWTKTANPTDAAAHVYPVSPPEPADPAGYSLDELENLRPFAKLDLYAPHIPFGEQQFVYNRVASFAYLDSGKLTLDLLDSIDPADADDWVTAKIKFMNNVGLVIADMANLAGTDAFLSVSRFELYQGPERVDLAADTQGDFWRVQFLIHYP